MSDYKSNRKSFWLAVVMMLACLITTGFALWYNLSSQSRINRQFEDIKKQLEQYNIPEQTNITPDEAQYLLAIAQYCEAHNECKGDSGVKTELLQPTIIEQQFRGVDGTTPPCYFEDAQCRGSNGLTPPCYFTDSQCVGQRGSDGSNGTNGREVERQCNAERNRMEWRLQGEENWRVEYNLAPGQTCATEEEL